MKFRQFLNVVPKAVQVWAWILASLPLLAAVIVGYETADRGDVVRTMLVYSAAGIAAGIFFATWLLCLGFVYADARRRAMRPVLWVLVAGLFPHLLGFLLYFVLRQPIASICSHCGMTVSSHQRFCSWCGSAQLQSRADEAQFGTNSSQGASQ